MKSIIAALVVVLIVLHHDVWFWDDARLVFGFLPIGLAYHAGLSVAASIVWFLAVRFAWPEGLEHEPAAEAAQAVDAATGPVVEGAEA